MSRNNVVLLTCLIMLLCYRATLAGMLHQWLTDEDMGHGIVVPLAIAWILWRERKAWLNLAPEPTAWGWPLLACGLGLHLVGALGGGLFLSSIAFLFSVTGAVLIVGGWPFARQWSFPLFLALFMLPKLAIVYNQATLPLQLTASQLAARILLAGGYAVLRSGNVLEVAGHQILVAEACNGIRFLLPLAFVAALLGYLSGTALRVRALLIAAAVPIAILSNALRVAVSGANPLLAEGSPHQIAGFILFLFSLGLLATALAVFRRLFEAER